MIKFIVPQMASKVPGPTPRVMRLVLGWPRTNVCGTARGWCMCVAIYATVRCVLPTVLGFWVLGFGFR
eukprot:3594338-Rhodomonas_salina.2